jgi:hypothetical protein
MTAAYPGAIKTWTPLTDAVNGVGGDEAKSENINSIYDEINALETKLGTNPQGSAADLKTRLGNSISAGGFLNFKPATTLTISSGSVTPTQNYHRVDTEAAAASDNLDTITALSEGWILFLTSVADARDVTLRSGVGNILCAGGKDITLGTAADLAILIYDDVADKWLASATTAGALTNVANTWTAKQSFSAGFATAVASVNANTTLDNTHQVVGVDATSGAKTIALPAAAGCTGQRYDIIKIDSSANAVTIDGNGAETINGAATYALSTQWSAITVISNGSSWWII